MHSAYKGIDIILFPHTIHAPNTLTPNTLHLIKFKEEKNVSFFMLSKMIDQYYFLIKISDHKLCTSERNLLNLFSTILTKTSMPFWDHIGIDKNPIEQLIDYFGLMDKTLAEFLDCAPSTITRTDKRKLLKKNPFFWSAISGYSIEYLLEDSTIPHYGNSPAFHDDFYKLLPMIQLAHSEMFLQNIVALKEFQKNLGYRKNKNTMFSRKYIQDISVKAVKLANELGKLRFIADNIYEKYANTYMESIHSNVYIPICQDYSNANIIYSYGDFRKIDTELKSKADDFVADIIAVLDKCIHELQQLHDTHKNKTK